jgi:threonylcarbamoyladenosine tRNA methylthiotransferase MtaB
MRRVAVHTLGCKLNFAETATIARQFEQKGYRVVGIDDEAEVCVINTCSVTDRADRECRQMVRRALRHSPDAFVVVLGCYAQLRPEEIARIPGVDLILGTKEKFEIFNHVDGFTKLSCAQTFVSPVTAIEAFEGASSVGSADRTRAFLKVQDGCDYSCAFCTIPLARGVSRSMTVPEVINRARDAVTAGYKEIVLTGVNVGDYGRKTGSTLLGLLEELVLVEGLLRIRISSVEPNLLFDELVAFWAANPKLCKHFHIPLQAGSDTILQGMRRRYQREFYAGRVALIRASMPLAGIGADVITGFPGETDRLFEETYRFLVDLPISYLHAFTYSSRPNTVARTLPGDVEPRVRFRRSEMLRILGAKKRRAFYQSFVGKTKDVLVEDLNSKGEWSGLTPEYVRVTIKSDLNLKNQLVRVEIEELEDDACRGQIIDTSLWQSNQPPLHSQNEVSLCD